MRPLKSLISLDNAKDIIEKNTTPLTETERVSLVDLNGRIAAQDIIANFNVPPFRRAAMDGYALIAESTFTATEDNPINLKCIDIVHAGEFSEKVLSKNECIEIATGAMVPDSADAVIQVELTNPKAETIEILKAIPPRTNISEAGVDVKKGEKVIEKGDVFNPAKIGVLAALNLTQAEVFLQPKVAIIPTGREIAALGQDLKKAQVYDINSYTIATLVKKIGAVPIIYDIVPDSFDELEEAVLTAIEHDLIIIGGGSSVGERDINIDVIEKHGDILFHGVQVKPGKPTLFGKIKNTPVMNLPGYPTSCLVNGYIFMAPLIRKLANLPQEQKQIVKAKLGKKIISRLGRHQILTVKIEEGIAIPVFKESSAITSMARADGYIEIPFNVDLIEKGEEVEVVLF